MHQVGRPFLAATLSIAALAALAACAQAPSATTPAAAASPAATPSASPAATAAPKVTPDATPPPVAAPPAWSQLAPTEGPAAREDHVWRIDADGTTAYLFGGRSGAAVYDDLWAYDLANDTWRELAPQGTTPNARFGHEAAWVEDMGLVIFAGQRDESTFFNDVWAYDPEANVWQQLPTAGAAPVARYGSCAAIGPDARLWISHGFTSEGNRFSDTRAYDFAAGAWTDETPTGDPPVVRCLHACWWTDTGAFVLFGGQTTGVTALGDLWRLRLGDGSGGHAWERIAGDLPSDRNLYASTRVDNATWVFGGQAIDGTYLDDVWRFDDPANGAVPVLVEDVPPPGRAGAELIHDAERARVLLFGGKDASGALGDLWELPLD